MPKVILKIIPDLEKNSLTFSKNYRLFTSKEPVPTVSKIVSFSESISLGSGNTEENLRRLFRYSTNQGDWSLWFELNPNNIEAVLGSIVLDGESNFFAEFKYEYDNGTPHVLNEPIKVNEIKLGLQTTKTSNQDLFTPGIYCSDERCPAIVGDRLSSFQPYSVDSAVGIYQEMTFQTNRIFGQDVVYFRTEPDRKSADFVFKEWTLFKVMERKCLKVLIPDNNIPDNKPSFEGAGIGFMKPFEIHIDHKYFQTIFGKESQPRKRDFLFFPMINRMYEIQGSYLYRGFMLVPAYWKMTLKEYNPNIDTIIPEEHKETIDNLILSSETAFESQIKSTTKDAVNKQQFKTISNRFDESRSYLSPDMSIPHVGKLYNYGNLIEYSYDLSSISSTTSNFRFTNTLNDDYGIINGNFISAYEGSSIFNAWLNGQIRTGDLNLNNLGQTYYLKTDGPKTDHGLGLRYVNVHAYSSMIFSSATERPLYLIDSETLRVKTRSNGTIYHEKGILSDIQKNLTFSCLLKVNSSTKDFYLLRAFDQVLQKGIQIYGSIRDDSSGRNLTIVVNLNNNIYKFAVGLIDSDKWYQVFIPISLEFKQAGIYVYSFIQDPANVQNFNQLTKLYEENISITDDIEFNESDFYAIPSGNISLANIRVFNTMVQEEDHDYLISQLTIRDESMLQLIDNCRPRLGNPYVTRNR